MKEYLKNPTGIIVLIAIILGFLMPNYGIVIKPYLTYLLMILMFFSFLGVNVLDIPHTSSQVLEGLGVLAIIHIASPLILFLFKSQFESHVFLGLLLASSVSSGISVVVLSKMLGGDQLKALGITVISNVVAPIILPVVLGLFAGRTIQVDYFMIGITIFKVVIIPLFFASLFNRSVIKNNLKKISHSLSLGVLFLLIFGSIASIQSDITKDTSMALYIGLIVCMLVGINFLLGYALGSDKVEKITYGVTASYKNYTLSTVLAVSLFGSAVALPSVIYIVVTNLMLVPVQYLSNNKRDG
ncbi:hypothetical protein KC717_04410 [Candidatus Dojkabacteria bacterium]|uniref:Bile acid:sodium symporter family protein n=1 Tax=Candidatus Dojkabacteria bacterium TaxID=2099670 RepID=A0A955L8D3_9BACT|nr:hypothetical protein [Candidatus Dojkabacteria bacterium]